MMTSSYGWKRTGRGQEGQLDRMRGRGFGLVRVRVSATTCLTKEACSAAPLYEREMMQGGSVVEQTT